MNTVTHCPLSFGQIYRLQPDLAEVIIDEGIEMTLAMVEQYHHCLLTHLRAPFSLLINKRNRYTYNYAAQAQLATLKEINAMAVVAYNRFTEIATQSLIEFPREVTWNLELFSAREPALVWLREQQQLMTERT